jgi:penicillin-binding protein 1A
MASFPFTKAFSAKHPRFTRSLLLVVCFFASFGAGFAYASWAMVCRAGRCPPADALSAYEPRQTSKLYAADGRFIAELGIERRTLVQLKDIPPLVRNAFVVTEDKRFYRHAGVDWKRVPGALLTDIRNRNFSEGFSTLTMQLARNIFPERISSEKSLVRKLKEIKVARAIEQKYSKDKILELYLNQINLGNGAYGIETAAQRYFGKSVKDLNVAEAATLAAIPKGPARYNPRLFPDRAIERRNTIIALMRDAGVINAADASEARAYPLRLATRVETGEIAPYYVEWIREQLDDKFGKQLYEQGLKVYTTLDLDLQSAAERALERQLRAIESGRYGPYPHISYERYTAQAGSGDQSQAGNSPYLQGAFIAMDPRTGAIRALIGGRDFDDSKFDRATQAVRQPGSTFKPIVYADAIHNGRPLSYTLDDSPLTVEMPGSPPWTPRNFEPDFAGKIPMRRALYQSRNVPTIRLGMELGVQSVIDEARAFGLTTPIPGYPSIFIGAADVLPIEMVSAYTTFATLGTHSRRRSEGHHPLGTRADDGVSAVTRRGVVDGQRHERRRATRNGGGKRRRSLSLSGRWQNRNDERRDRRLVHRLHVGLGRRRMDGFRSAQEDQSERARRNSRGAGVDVIHERGLSSKAGTARLADASGSRREAGRCVDEHARDPVLSS